MKVIHKLLTALRGGAREVGEAVVDANAIRIFEQEIRDAENHVEQAKRDLAAIMAQTMQTGREIDRLNKEIERFESYGLQALDKGEETLALEIAGKIADLQREQAAYLSSHATLEDHEVRLKDIITATNQTLIEMNRQLTIVKSTESLHKATASITHNFTASTSRLVAAKESLEHIHKRQEAMEDRLKAGQMLEDSLSGKNLEAKMKEAGIGEYQAGAEEILAKLKEKRLT